MVFVDIVVHAKVMFARMPPWSSRSGVIATTPGGNVSDGSSSSESARQWSGIETA
jgi:hypothetical protein